MKLRPLTKNGVIFVPPVAVLVLVLFVMAPYASAQTPTGTPTPTTTPVYWIGDSVQFTQTHQANQSWSYSEVNMYLDDNPVGLIISGTVSGCGAMGPAWELGNHGWETLTYPNMWFDAARIGWYDNPDAWSGVMCNVSTTRASQTGHSVTDICASVAPNAVVKTFNRGSVYQGPGYYSMKSTFGWDCRPGGGRVDVTIAPIYYGTPPPPPPPPDPCGFVPSGDSTVRYVQANNGNGETFSGLTPGSWYQISVQPGTGDGGDAIGWFASLFGDERVDVEATLESYPPRWAGWDDMDDTPPAWIACHHTELLMGRDFFVGYFQATDSGKITVRVNDNPLLFFDNREGVYVSITPVSPPPTTGNYYNVLGDSDMEQYPHSSYWYVPLDGQFGRVTNDAAFGDAYCGNGFQVLAANNWKGADFSSVVSQDFIWYGGEMYAIAHAAFDAGNAHPSLGFSVWCSANDGTPYSGNANIYSPVANGRSQWDRYVFDLGNIPAGNCKITASVDSSAGAWVMLDNVIVTGDKNADMSCQASSTPTPTRTPTPTSWPTATPYPEPMQSCSFESPIGWGFDGGAFAAPGTRWGNLYAFVPAGGVVSQRVMDTDPTGDYPWVVSMWAYGSGEVWVENSDGMRQLVYSFQNIPDWTWFESGYIPSWFVGNGVTLELHGVGGAAGYDNVYMSEMVGSFYDVCDVQESATSTPYPTPTGTLPTSTPTPNGWQSPTPTPGGWNPTATITPWPTATDWRTPTPFRTNTPTPTPPWFGTPTPGPGTPTWTPSPTLLPSKTPTPSPTSNGNGGFPFPTGTPSNQPPPGAYAPCEKPENPWQISGWLEYNRCRTLSYFAWGPPQSATAQAIPTVYFGDREPFGTINELEQTTHDVQEVVNQYSWSQGLDGMGDAPSFDVFMQPQDSWFMTGRPPLEQLANNSGVEPTYVCPGGDIEGMLGPLMTGVCFAYGVLFEHGIMPWLQLLVDLGAILFFIIYLYHKWIDAGTGGQS